MGTRTVASKGDCGGQQSQVQNLSRQGSVYSLTLNEVQNHLGEPLHSMNLDDLLKVFPGEGSPYLSMDIDNSTNQYSSVPVLHRQGSTTANRSLTKKTVDEVWRDIQQKKSSEDRSSNHERQTTLGEMTLEDFLTKAGVVTEGSDKRKDTETRNAGSQGFALGPHWLQQYQMSLIQQQQQQKQQTQQHLMGAYIPARPVSQPMVVGTSTALETLFPEGQAEVISDSQSPGRKRGRRKDFVEKTVERRQKRMIKNRESAARSRARKQAYTNELENKVLRLEEENERLRKQKELDSILHAPPPEPKFQLRRSSSAPF